ncbi:MAG: radical SAM protein [Myxococcota bacterium]|nr:radical SAM protein [Myxococcota bacterium]
MNLVLDELVPLRTADNDYVFHVPTSSFYALDSETRGVLSALDGESLPEERLVDAVRASLSLEQPAVEEILSDLVALRLLVPPELRGRPSHDPVPPGEGIRNLVLHVAHTCNLACGYCYAEQGLYKGKATVMDPERAFEYVDWLFDQAEPDVGELGLTFFGGEPLLNWPVVEKTARYARQKSEETGLPIRFGITTNGTLVTPEIADFLNEIGALVTVSLDAIKEKNDRLRPYTSGRGSYDIVMEKIQPLLARGNAVARVTVTKINLDVVHTVETLLAAGFREVGCSPVDAKNEAYDLNGADYARLLEGFRVLTDRFIEEAAQGRKYGFSNISNILKAIHNGHNKSYPCGAGIQMVAGAPNGKMSLCHRFVGEEDFVLGSVQDGGLDRKKRRDVLDQVHLDQRSDCSTCWARSICSGGCHHVNFLFEGDPAKTYLTHCDWLRAWYKTGLEAYSRILESNPSFIQRFIDPGWVCKN